MIVRAPRPDANFYVLDKKISEDRRLSWAARGMLIFLLGKPDNWEVSVANLINETSEASKHTGRDGVYSILQELMSAGYVVRVQARTDAGTLAGVQYLVGETPREPHTDSPLPAQPDTAQPLPANPTLIRTEEKQELKKKQELNKPNPCPDILSDEAWESFVAHRKAKRAPLTEKSISLIGKTLMQAKSLGFDPVEVINRSVMNGWTGVFIPQTQPNRPAASSKAQQNDEWRDWLSDNPQGAGHVVDVVATEVGE